MKEKLKYDKYCCLENEYSNKVNRFSNIRMILFIIVVISFILKYYYYPFFFNVVFILSLVLFIVIVFIHDKYFKIYNYYVKYLEILNVYLDRENGNWKKFVDDGSDYLNDRSDVFRDLDILGKNSLFQFINVGKTLGGRDKLISRLSNQYISESDLKMEQEAVLELSNKIGFVIDFQVLLKEFEGKKINLSKNMFYFEKREGSRKIDLFIGSVAGSVCLLLFLLAIFNVISFSYFYGMFLFNLVISYLYAYIYREEFFRLDKVINSYSPLTMLFNLILVERFESKKLNVVKEEISKCYSYLESVNRLDTMNSLRTNVLASFVFNGFCCFNLFLMYRFSSFLDSSFSSFATGVGCIEDMEAMISLANIGIIRNDKCMPVYSENVNLNFENIKHPLLIEDECVGNDFSFEKGVNIITGSNMSGKTTFIRMIGINLILMNAGGFVCADSFESSYFKLFTSMRVVDDIEKGISTFYGELLRISEMIQYRNNGNMLVLIDEIFKGTNYQDRIYGAKEVIKKLRSNNVIAFITTHDFELCDERGVSNYYFKEDYEGERIVFDYKIRKGKSSSTNAKYLMEKLGIID